MTARQSRPVRHADLILLLAKCRAAQFFQNGAGKMPADVAAAATGRYAGDMRTIVQRALDDGLVEWPPGGRMRCTVKGDEILDGHLKHVTRSTP